MFLEGMFTYIVFEQLEEYLVLLDFTRVDMLNVPSKCGRQPLNTAIVYTIYRKKLNKVTKMDLF